MSVTIVELERRYCLWRECAVSASLAVYDDGECVGAFCARHAEAVKRKIEKEQS